jgi:hypothetical protein
MELFDQPLPLPPDGTNRGRQGLGVSSQRVSLVNDLLIALFAIYQAFFKPM